MRVVATIEARMKSTRLPGKNLRQILGKPMLERLIERLRLAKTVDDIVIATTDDPSDDSIEALASRLGVAWFRGSTDDVLDRVLRAARNANADVIVEITGDCPLIDPAIVDKVVGVYQSNKFDYVSNIIKLTYPDGMDVQVFSTNVLEEVAHLTMDPADREHVSLYIYEHPEKFALHNVVSGLAEKYWHYRLTVDTADDFALITAIFKALYPINPRFGLGDVLALLERQPALLELNRHITAKAVH
ncbi:3-deoxy-manno-octulosonate cytidylyltransferase [mine drainage metagenome]|uniref:3-deoxy-manno-octulosonate cytidylyltransferase n=1 Tax=mine drainage metagenome TaxID=410659 RepID=A0A1J5R8E0_9ZZZZ